MSKKQENNTTDKVSEAEFLRWFKPIIQALRDLGGSSSPSKVREKIIENESLTDEELQKTRGKTHSNKFANEVAFARLYLVKSDYLDKNSGRGVWSLTEKGKKVEMTEELATEIFKEIVSRSKK